MLAATDELTQARQAVFNAQMDYGQLYLAEYRLGKILQSRGNLTGSLISFSHAYEHLEFIRTSLNSSKEQFQTQIKPVYYAYADVLLQSNQLEKAQRVMESFKDFELKDYFQDACVSKIEKKVTELSDNTAVIYPIILPNRLELLVNIPNGIKRVSVDVSGNKFKETAIKFHKNLQKRGGAFVKQSKQLYDWLIKPITPILNQLSIQTIVIIPDDVLRLVPISALMPGKKRFLIEDYAIATTPSLYLTEPKILDSINVMLNGVSESVQGFTQLKHVKLEIVTLSSLMGGNSFLDSQFKLDDLVHNLKANDYQIIHIATHAQFNRDPEKTFILTYDDKLTMNRLESLFEDKSIELLTLSACQTAKGDERAALGLAGVAIKAGARSALASLWAVQDKSTALLMQEFYKGLNDRLSKAKALQQAQIKLISQKKFRHPNNWAPFLLIGNWL